MNFCAVLVFLVPFLSQAARAPRWVSSPNPLVMSGGWSAASDEEMLQVWQHCLNALQGSDDFDTLTALEAPMSMQQQIVQGVQYKFTFPDGAEVQIWERPNEIPDVVSITGSDGGDPNAPFTDSEEAVDCFACVKSGGVWEAAMCVQGCGEIADASCWEDANGCKAEQREREESARCNAANGCSQCLNAGTNCVWDTDGDLCYSMAGLWFQPENVIRQSELCPNADATRPQKPAAIGGDSPGMPGGWMDMPAAEVASKWEEVVEVEENEKRLESESLDELESPVRGETQVVAGVNYRFFFDDGTRITVFEQSWTTSGLQITKIERNSQQLKQPEGSMWSRGNLAHHYKLIAVLASGLLLGILCGIFFHHVRARKAEKQDLYYDIYLDETRRV